MAVVIDGSEYMIGGRGRTLSSSRKGRQGIMCTRMMLLGEMSILQHNFECLRNGRIVPRCRKRLRRIRNSHCWCEGGGNQVARYKRFEVSVVASNWLEIGKPLSYRLRGQACVVRDADEKVRRCLIS